MAHRSRSLGRSHKATCCHTPYSIWWWARSSATGLRWWPEVGAKIGRTCLCWVWTNWFSAAMQDSGGPGRLDGPVGRFGLWTNVEKTVVMVFQLCRTADIQTDKEYTRWVTGEGITYRERQWEMVRCPDCGMDLAAGYNDLIPWIDNYF